MNNIIKKPKPEASKPVQAADYGKHAEITAKSETATAKDTDGRKTLMLWK